MTPLHLIGRKLRLSEVNDLDSLLTGTVFTHSTNFISIRVCQNPRTPWACQYGLGSPSGGNQHSSLGTTQTMSKAVFCSSPLIQICCTMKKNMRGSQSALSLGQCGAKEVIHAHKHHPGCLVPLMTPNVVKLWQECQTLAHVQQFPLPVLGHLNKTSSQVPLLPASIRQLLQITWDNITVTRIRLGLIRGPGIGITNIGS